MFDRPCSKFVVLLLFRLYSCTFVNVDAVNGMSFTLFFGEKRQKCAFWCVYIHHSFPLGYNVYSFIWSSVILKKRLQSGMVFFFFLFFWFLNPLSERPASICTRAVTSIVDSFFFLMCDSWKIRKNNTRYLNFEAAFSPHCYHGNFTEYDNNYFCTEECCILEQLLLVSKAM